MTDNIILAIVAFCAGWTTAAVFFSLLSLGTVLWLRRND